MIDNNIDKNSLNDFFKIVNKKNKKNGIKNIVVLSEMYLNEDMSDLEFEHVQKIVSSDSIDQIFTIGEFKNHINILEDFNELYKIEEEKPKE